jgi:virulence factor
MKAPIRVGIAGLGRMGGNHARVLSELTEYFRLVGAYEPGQIGFSAEGYPLFSDYEKLLDNCDAVVVAAPTTSHAELIELGLLHRKYILVEKPAVANLSEWKKLSAKGLPGWDQLMVGHIERFNPAFNVFLSHMGEFRAICSQRLAPFSNRGSDVSVIWDLLIHDLDLVLAIFEEYPELIVANGFGGVGIGVDYVTVRLGFSENRFAQLTASRIAPDTRRELSFLGEGVWGRADLANRKFEKSVSSGGETRTIKIEVAAENALKNELMHWHGCIVNKNVPTTGVKSSGRLMELCEAIENQLN